MGLEASSLKGLESNEYLERFCGEEPLTTLDPIWNKLFSHSIKPVLVRDDDFLLDTTLEKLRTSLILNNLKTKNLAALIEVFASRANELQVSVQTSDNIFIWQAYNALFIIRSILKCFYSNLTNEECANHLERTAVKPNEDAGSSCGLSEPSDPLELLMETLVLLITDLPITNITYMLHLEAINTMIVVLSQQMFIPTKPAIKLPSFRYLMQGGVSNSSIALTNKLLSHYVEQLQPPYPCWNNEGSGSIVIGVASGIWNIIRKGVGLSPYSDEIMEGLKEHSLAKQSLNLLLILVNHCTGHGQGDGFVNPFRAAITLCANDAGATDSIEPLPGVHLPTFNISFAKLYSTICQQINTDETTLLLYLLTFENVEFMSYIMARCDIETLVLPMIQTLYNAPTSSTHHIYMTLIILLILSEEDLFNRQIHDIPLKNIHWYTERNVGDITLGGLIILVIIRTIQYNILKMRDKYLHTNCLASLANMSSKFRSLHPYVAQRLISLFETLGKRYLKLLQRVEQTPHQNTNEPPESELAQDIAVLEEVVRMVLEILNSTLSHQLAQNRHLVYTLLYKKDTLEPFRRHEATQDLVANLDAVINYFTRRLGNDYHSYSAAQVMDVLQDGFLHWKPDILKKFPELKFRYVEEDSPEAFFVPYVWSLIFQRSGIHWTNVSMELFNLEPEIYT